VYDRDYYHQRYLNLSFGLSAEKRRSYLFKARTVALQKVLPKPELILEIGCGVGHMSKYLARLPNRPCVHASDLSEDALGLARQYLKDEDNIRLHRLDAHALPFQENTFHVITAFDVIEHLSQPSRFAEEAFRTLCLSGILMISTPNPASLGYRIKSHNTERPGQSFAERKLQWFGFRDDTHVNVRSHSSWRKLFEKAGFERVRDGSDFWWDVPYFKWMPMLIQRFIFTATHIILTKIFYFLPWKFGENYIAIFRKPA